MLVVVQLGNSRLRIEDGVATCDYKIVERITNRMLDEHRPIKPADEITVAHKIAYALGGEIVYPAAVKNLPPGSY